MPWRQSVDANREAHTAPEGVPQTPVQWALPSPVDASPVEVAVLPLLQPHIHKQIPNETRGRRTIGRA